MTTPTILKVGSLEEALCAVPYLLGFHPSESLVLVFIEAGRVRLTARVDLTDAADPGPLWELLSRAFGRFEDAELLAVAYAGDHDLADRILGEIECGLDSTSLLAAVVVDDGRWWFSGLPDVPGGSYRPDTSAVAAEAVVNGLAAQRSRAKLTELVTQPASADCGELARLFEDTRSQAGGIDTCWADELVLRLTRALGAGAASSHAELAWLGVLASEPTARDAAARSITCADAREHFELWAAVLRICPTHWRHGPLTILGLAAWVCGEGAIQTECLRMASDSDPQDPFVLFQHSVQASILPGWEWDRLNRRHP